MIKIMAKKKIYELDDESVKSLYLIAKKDLKLELENQFGKNFLLGSLRERIRNYSDICRELNTKELSLKDFNHLPEEQRKSALAEHQIKNIVKVFNEGRSFNQYKYYPYFRKNESGWLLYGVYSYFVGSSDLGSGFYYVDRETCTYCTNLFIEIYSNYLG